jgi:Invasion associated locus B (IalB) protein
MIRRTLLLVILSMLPGLPGMAQQQPPVVTKKPPAPVAAQKPAPGQKPPAATPKAGGPQRLGTFDDWTAATHTEAGQMVCYAFTRAQSSAPALPGRSAVILTVTQRVSGRDAVALEAGFAYAPDAAVTLQADKATLEFYTSQRAAFARKGHDAVTAFQTAGKAIAHSPGPHEATVTDTFSLKGFSAAYAAISKACPPK